MQTPEEELDCNIYDAIERSYVDFDTKVDYSSRIEIVPSSKRLQEATDRIMEYIRDYIDNNFPDLCKQGGLQEKCSLCEQRFKCWTK